MKTSPRLERPALARRLDNFGRNSSESFPISTLIKSRFFNAPKLWPADERHVRRPGWTELFYDLVFAAAISQLSTPLEADYSLHGVVHYAFLLALVFLAWLGYTNFSTQFAVDDVVQRALIVAQVFFVAVMAANATGPLSSRDAAGFGAAYGGVRAVLALQYARVIGLPGTRTIVIRRIGWLVAAAVVWTASALLPAPHRYVAWCLAFSMDIANSWPPSRGTIVLPPGGRAFSREIRAADHHSVRRICRFGDARNRKSDGLEFFSRFRRGAESGLGICSLVVLLRRRYRLGNSAHADKQARGPTAYLDRASFFAVPGHRHSRGRCAPWYCVAAGRIFRRD